MGMIHAEIELVNGAEHALALKNQIGEEEVKRITVKALVDSGSYMMAINENIQEYLQLPVIDKMYSELANGERIQCDVVSCLEVRFQGKNTSCRALVLPGDSEVLMGSIPLEDLDAIIDPARQELIVDHSRIRRL